VQNLEQSSPEPGDGLVNNAYERNIVLIHPAPSLLPTVLKHRLQYY
jgi:hypothetical protein